MKNEISIGKDEKAKILEALAKKFSKLQVEELSEIFCLWQNGGKPKNNIEKKIFGELNAFCKSD